MSHLKINPPKIEQILATVPADKLLHYSTNEQYTHVAFLDEDGDRFEVTHTSAEALAARACHTHYISIEEDPEIEYYAKKFIDENIYAEQSIIFEHYLLSQKLLNHRNLAKRNELLCQM